MGITGLLPLLKPITKQIHVKKYRNKKVAVDAYVWLHRGAYSCSSEICQNIPTDGYIKYCMKMVNLLRHYNVEPMMVFDGARLPVKQGTEEDRRMKRNFNMTKAISLLRRGKKTEADEVFRKAVDITPQMAYNVIQVLKREGVECLVSPYEADAQLAYLGRNGIVDAIVTEDSDLIPYGAPCVLFKLSKKGYADEIILNNLACNTTPGFSFQHFSHDMVVRTCVLSGCDYISSLQGIGLKKSYTLVNTYKDLNRLKTGLRYSSKHTIPSTYFEKFTEAELTFRYQRVWDPIEEMMTTLNPLPAHLQGRSLDFLGPVLSHDIVSRIVRAEIDPMTHQPFKNELDYSRIQEHRYFQKEQEEDPQQHGSILRFFQPQPRHHTEQPQLPTSKHVKITTGKGVFQKFKNPSKRMKNIPPKKKKKKKRKRKKRKKKKASSSQPVTYVTSFFTKKKTVTRDEDLDDDRENGTEIINLDDDEDDNFSNNNNHHNHHKKKKKSGIKPPPTTNLVNEDDRIVVNIIEDESESEEILSPSQEKNKNKNKRRKKSKKKQQLKYYYDEYQDDNNNNNNNNMSIEDKLSQFKFDETKKSRKRKIRYNNSDDEEEDDDDKKDKITYSSQSPTKSEYEEDEEESTSASVSQDFSDIQQQQQQRQPQIIEASQQSSTSTTSSGGFDYKTFFQISPYKAGDNKNSGENNRDALIIQKQEEIVEEEEEDDDDDDLFGGGGIGESSVQFKTPDGQITRVKLMGHEVHDELEVNFIQPPPLPPHDGQNTTYIMDDQEEEEVEDNIVFQPQLEEQPQEQEQEGKSHPNLFLTPDVTRLRQATAVIQDSNQLFANEEEEREEVETKKKLNRRKKKKKKKKSRKRKRSEQQQQQQQQLEEEEEENLLEKELGITRYKKKRKLDHQTVVEKRKLVYNRVIDLENELGKIGEEYYGGDSNQQEGSEDSERFLGSVKSMTVFLRNFRADLDEKMNDFDNICKEMGSSKNESIEQEEPKEIHIEPIVDEQDEVDDDCVEVIQPQDQPSLPQNVTTEQFFEKS